MVRLRVRLTLTLLTRTPPRSRSSVSPPTRAAPSTTTAPPSPAARSRSPRRTTSASTGSRRSTSSTTRGPGRASSRSTRSGCARETFQSGCPWLRPRLHLSLPIFIYTYLSLPLPISISIYRLSIYLCLAGGCVAARAVCGGRTREAHSVRAIEARRAVCITHIYNTDRQGPCNSPWQLVSASYIHQKSYS